MKPLILSGDSIIPARKPHELASAVGGVSIEFVDRLSEEEQSRLLRRYKTDTVIFYVDNISSYGTFNNAVAIVKSWGATTYLVGNNTSRSDIQADYDYRGKTAELLSIIGASEYEVEWLLGDYYPLPLDLIDLYGNKQPNKFIKEAIESKTKMFFLDYSLDRTVVELFNQLPHGCVFSNTTTLSNLLRLKPHWETVFHFVKFMNIVVDVAITEDQVPRFIDLMRAIRNYGSYLFYEIPYGSPLMSNTVSVKLHNVMNEMVLCDGHTMKAFRIGDPSKKFTVPAGYTVEATTESPYYTHIWYRDDGITFGRCLEEVDALNSSRISAPLATMALIMSSGMQVDDIRKTRANGTSGSTIQNPKEFREIRYSIRHDIMSRY